MPVVKVPQSDEKLKHSNATFCPVVMTYKGHHTFDLTRTSKSNVIKLNWKLNLIINTQHVQWQIQEKIASWKKQGLLREKTSMFHANIWPTWPRNLFRNCWASKTASSCKTKPVHMINHQTNIYIWQLQSTKRANLPHFGCLLPWHMLALVGAKPAWNHQDDQN